MSILVESFFQVRPFCSTTDFDEFSEEYDDVEENYVK